MDTEQKSKLGYEVALAQLREHPRLIWTRNNFFLLTQTGLLGFTLNADKQPVTYTRIMVCVTGLALALIWLWVNWAARKLQRQWRGIVLKFEKNLFGDEAEGHQAQGPFRLSIESGEGKYRRLSITLALMLLPTVFAVVWLLLLIQIYRG